RLEAGASVAGPDLRAPVTSAAVPPCPCVLVAAAAAPLPGGRHGGRFLQLRVSTLDRPTTSGHYRRGTVHFTSNQLRPIGNDLAGGAEHALSLCHLRSCALVLFVRRQSYFDRGIHLR